MNTTYIRILRAIELFAKEHLQIQKFSSDFPEQLPNFATKDEAYPILYVSPSNAVFDLNTNRFDLRVFCYDVIQKDRTNINTILSDTNSILNDLVLWLREGDLAGIDLINEPNVSPINNNLLDYVAGWELTLTLEVDTYTVCDIPFNETPIVTDIVNNIVYASYLTCDTLAECDTFNNAIDNLQEQINIISGGTEFDCNQLSGCTVIQDINSELSGLTTQINEISATTESIQENYVPYTGATQDVNLGAHSLRADEGFVSTWGDNGTLRLARPYDGITKEFVFYGGTADYSLEDQYCGIYATSEEGIYLNMFGISDGDSVSNGLVVGSNGVSLNAETGSITNYLSFTKDETYTTKKIITNQGFYIDNLSGNTAYLGQESDYLGLYINDTTSPLGINQFQVNTELGIYYDKTSTNDLRTIFGLNEYSFQYTLLDSGIETNVFSVDANETFSRTQYRTDEGFEGNYLRINTSISEPVEAGKIVWNSQDGTFDMGLLNGVTLQAGQEMHMYAKASGVIANGDAVQFAGAQGSHLLIKKAVPSEINTNPEYFVGIATQDFSNNQFGYVTVFGQVRDLNTSMYSGGTVLYYQSSGTTTGLLTNVRPTGPNAKITVAAVVRSHQNQGVIFVRPHMMPRIGGLQDIEITAATNNDVLTYNSSTQVWENQSEEFRIRQKFNVISTDFNGTVAASIFPFTFAAYNTGTHLIGVTTNGTNPGTTRLVSSATPNSGGVLSSNSLAAANIVPVVGQEMDYVFRTPTVISGAGTTIRAGFLTAANAITDAAFGIYMEIVDNQLYGKTANNNIRSTTSTAYTLPNGGVWYHMRVVYKAANLVEYTLYNMVGTILWTNTLTTNIPTSAYGCNLLAFSSASTIVNTELVTNDYLAFTLPSSNRGALN